MSTDRFKVIKGHELLGIEPNSGEGPQVCFSSIVDDDRLKAAIENQEAKGYRFVNLGVFQGSGCEALFERVEQYDTPLTLSSEVCIATGQIKEITDTTQKVVDNKKAEPKGTDKQKLEALLKSFGETDIEVSTERFGLHKMHVIKHCYTVYYFHKDGRFHSCEGTLR